MVEVIFPCVAVIMTSVCARAAYVDGNRLYVRADHPEFTAEQLTRHEVGHDMLEKGEIDRDKTMARARELLGDQRFQESIGQYEAAYRGSGLTPEDVRDEVICDSLGGMNIFRGISGMEETAQNILDASFVATEEQEQANGTRGPPEGKKNTAMSGGEKYSEARLYEDVDLSKDGRVYTYDFLTSLPDMKVVTLPEIGSLRGSDNRIDTGAVVRSGMENARAVGTVQGGKTYVQNRYTGHNLRIDNSSVRHGLNGGQNRLLTNSRLGAVIGDVVKNAVPINALHNKADGVIGTYAMAGYAVDSAGREFVSIVTVEQRSREITGVESYDVTHAVSGRQKNSSQADTKSQGVYPIKAANISIPSLIQNVNSTHQSILSDDVLKHLGETRNPNGDYTNRVKFSMETPVEETKDLVAHNQLRRDNQGKELTEQQQEFFKDSKVRDEDGALKVMYQGGTGDFTVFDRSKSSYANLYGRGFYFTDSQSHAAQYGNTRSFYLNIQNPVSTEKLTITKPQMRKFLKAVAENDEDFSFENYGQGATVDSVLKSIYGKNDFAMLSDVNLTAIGDMVEAVKLFNEVNGTDFDGLILSTETVTFRSNQAKNIDNANPTQDPDIRFSQDLPELESLRKENQRLQAQVESWKGQLKRTTDPEKYSGDYYDVLYKAMGDNREDYEKIYQDMLDFGFTEDKIRNAMEKRMKEDQGVEKVSDLDRRYLNPTQEAEWDKAYGMMSGSSLWGSATEAQRDAVEDKLYNVVTQNTAGQKIQEKIDGGAAYGLDETEYMLYLLALSMADKPTESGKMGTYTNDEVAEAIHMVPGLTDEERSYLWTAQGKSDKSNPWG